MNTILLAITAIALVVLVALVLRPVQDTAEPEQEEDARISPLLRGINYLLCDEPDLALKEMVQVARLRSEAADVYMALGEMFRSKGEIGRAVRIHQNLLARPDLPKSVHLQAHLALATDFQTGGLLDRALYQYQKALAIQSDHAGALEASLRIREQSSEWLVAEDLLSRLERVRNASYSSHRAYLFSEMARQCHQQGHHDEAQTYAAKALQLDESCAPAYLVEIELLLAEQHTNEGMSNSAPIRADQVADNDAENDVKNAANIEAAIHGLWQQSREHFPLLIPTLLRHRAFYESKATALLGKLWHESKDAELMLGWIEAVAHERGTDAARALAESMNFEPGSLRQSLRLHATLGETSDVHSRFARQWRKTARNYACEQCGIEVVEMRWQCPQCHSWGTLHPKKDDTI